MHSGRVTRRTVLLGASAGGVVALASCGNLSAGPKASVSPTPSPVDVPKPIITCTSPSGLENMHCEDGFDVQVTNGELVTIRVYDAEGKRVSGKIFGGHFQPTWNLHMRSTYTVKV